MVLVLVRLGTLRTFPELACAMPCVLFSFESRAFSMVALARVLTRLVSPPLKLQLGEAVVSCSRFPRSRLHPTARGVSAVGG